MKNQFVSYEIAKQLQEKGFNQPCIGMFLENKEIYSLSNPTKDFTYVTNEGKQHNISAPLWQQVIDWLYTEHKLFVRPDFLSGETIYTLYDLSQGEKKRLISRATKNEAIEEALKLI